MKATRFIVAIAMAIALFVAPASQAINSVGEIPNGSLIKKDGSSSVYYYADEGRYVFPNERTFYTWYDGFDSVLTVMPNVLSSIPLRGNVTYRPGVRMVKIQTDPKVYAVDAGGTLRWVNSEGVARALYGNNWNRQIDDVPDAFFVNYVVGEPVNVAADFSPAQVRAQVRNIRENRVATPTPSTPDPVEPTPSTPDPVEPTPSTPDPVEPTPAASTISADRLQPSDLVYRGAFRLPAAADGMGWEWGGDALTYYPNGDPSGPADGYLGSLYGTGHAWNMSVSEIAIPIPRVSATKNTEDLNRATTLQGFADVRGGLFNPLEEIIRVGLEYLPAQGSQTSGKLYLAFGQHFQEEGSSQLMPSHAWCELDLSHPNTKGIWWVDGENIYSVNDYLFSIPEDWADAYVGGRVLATGRYRDGGWSGQGPSIYAIAPWDYGNPPVSGTHIQPIQLLQYDTSYDNDALFSSSARTINNYHHSDTWTGAAWLSSGDKAAVVFAGTKGFGDYWYGDVNGPCTDCASQRGWWSDRMDGQIIFYDPDDLAAVARGEMEPWQPQPYATMDLTPYLYRRWAAQEMFRVGAIAFDRTHGFLYLFEQLADGDLPLVHVWKVN